MTRISIPPLKCCDKKPDVYKRQIDNHGNRQRSLRASRLHSVDSMIMPTAHHDAIRSRDAADSKARTIGIKGV